MSDRDALYYYPVERGLFNAAARDLSPGHCPVCGKDGRWEGDRFIPANERQSHHPRCYCATIHKAGALAYDPIGKVFIHREAKP